MTHSVENRFIAIISAALLIVVAPLFTLFLALSSQQAAQSLDEHIDVVLAANAQALSKPLWDLDTESVSKIVAALHADPMIMAVRVTDNTGKVDISDITDEDSVNNNSVKISRNIVYESNYGSRDVGTITVRVPSLGWFSTLHEIELSFITIFVIAILTVFAAAILGNRFMVIRPLMRLTAAIEATRRLGSRHHVDWRSGDEIGRLAKSFNEMQSLLEREERQLRRAHGKTTEIYNLTPAMLFSLTEDDRIVAVSDYWLQATGYDRFAVLGHPLEDFIEPEDHAIVRSRRQTAAPGSTVAEITVRFTHRNGHRLHVLIAETELEPASNNTAGSLCVMTDVTALRQSEMLNHRQAITDHLTGLLNRQGFEASLESKIAEADAAGFAVTCLFVDLDRFKSINDNLGHAAGDMVLRQFVERLKPLLRPQDTIARLGGDEFAVLVTGADAEERGTALCQQVVDVFDMPFRIKETFLRLSASIGLAAYPRHAENGMELLHKSDLAMYARKRDGKNGAQIFDPAILDRARERAEIEADIEAAIAANWFEAHFQPIVDIESGKPAGFEALMRMRHPTKGLVSPAGVISVAEETGTIGQIGDLILNHAISNLARVSRQPGMAGTYVAVNFSPLQFDQTLPLHLISLFSRHQVHPSRVVIEITEAVLMHDNPEICNTLAAIREIGCRIALDDFGTGYSSLSYLSRFPVDIVKIDQSFVRSLADADSEIGRRNKMLIEGIIAISRKMGCRIVAEGVETQEQRMLLATMGADYAQGYYFSKPREIGDLIEALEHDLAPKALAS